MLLTSLFVCLRLSAEPDVSHHLGHLPALKQAGSEGELCPADGLGSAGSSSTLASSVIEVETERAEPRMDLQLGSNQQGEEEEDLTTLRAPPIVSITEEILEFINQSRVREGLTTMDQIQDRPSVADSPGNPTCFTCPLPPIASSPDQSLLFEHDQEGKEVKNSMNIQYPASESERATEEVQEIPDVTGEMEEMAEDNVEEKDKRGKASDDKAEHTLEITPSSDLQLSVSVEEKTDICSELQELDTESTVFPQSPDLPHQPIQRFQLPKKGSNLTKKDKKIIEKIRSYYEAAAEADDDEAADEGEARAGVISRRRSSISHIPTGLVKESVSRFSVNGHQGEVVRPNSKHEDGETNEDSGSCSSSGPATLPADGEADEPLSSSEVYPENPAESTISDEMKHQLSSTKDIPESDPKTFHKVETEILDKSWNIYKGSLEENLERPEEGKTVEATSTEEETLSLSECPENNEEERNCAVTQPDTNEPGPTRSQTEPSVHGPEQEQRQKAKQTKTQSTGSRTKTRDQANTKENLETFPSQSKVGRWSRHSRIVTANRALFEGMGSDVTGVDLFEVNPVVDPVLIENSERILSKVQTLARMYSAKASTMKVPLHHKRASTIRTQAWVSGRMSGHSTQNRDKSPSQKEKETGCAAQTRSETKTKHQACKQTSQNQAQTMIQEKQRIQEGSPESHTDDSLAKGAWPCKPQLLGHVTPTCDQQTDGFTLTRPKDFICVLTKPSSTPGETPSSLNLAYSNDTTVSSTSSRPSHHPRTQPEDQGSKRTCSIPSVSAAALDGRCSEFRDFPAEKHEDVPFYSESNVEQGEDGRLEQDEGRCVYSAGGDWTSGNFSTQPADSEACIPQTKASSKRSDADGHERDVAAARCKQDEMGHNEDQEVLETDQSLCSGPGSSAGLVHTPSQSRIAWVSHSGLDEEPSQREAWAEEATGPVGSTRGQKIVEPSRENEDSSADICASREHFILPSDSTIVNLMNDTTITETFKYLQKDEASSSSSVSRFTPTSQDSLPTFTNQRPTDLLAGVKRASSVPWTISSTPETGHRKSDEPVSELPLRISSPVLSVFSPSLIHLSPSPLRSATASSVQAPPCSSPFRVIPVSCPTAVSPTEFTSALSCLSPTPSTVSSGRTPAPSVLLSGDSSLSRGPSSSPTPPSNLHSSTCSSPSSSAFTRSLAASHISQSISQSMAKNNMARQQAPTITLVNQSSASTSSMRQRTPSPNPPPALQGTDTPAQLGCTKDGYQHPRCPSSSLRSSCLSQSSLSQCPPSPSAGLRQPHCSSSSSTSPFSSFLHPKTVLPHLGNKNTNNNNTAGLSTSNAYVGGVVSNGGCSGAEGSTETHQSHYPLWSGSHNRVARPFSVSEPSSRVHSPTPSPTPALFARLGSPPQPNYSSSMANKPPHPRSSRVGGSHNYLALHLDLTRASPEGSTFDDSSACVSPQILSPPPIGVPVWTNNVAAPQPRNPQYSTSPSLFSSTLGSQTHRISSSTSGRTSLSGSSPLPSQTVHRPLSASLADRPLSPPRTNGTRLRSSWVDLGQRSLGFLGNVRGSFEQLESCPFSPSSGWSSHSSSPSYLSPQACLQSPLSPTRFTPCKAAISGQHFTSVPWPDVQELSSKYNGTDSPETSVTPTAPLSSPGPTDSQSEWVGPELEEGTCRTQLICAYVARPSHQQNVSSSSCLILSPTVLTSSSPESHQQYNIHAQREPQVTASPPAPAVPSSSPLGSSPLSKQGNQKASYATTVNLQIAGSGRITSFSTAQVSLTQTLQGGAGPPGSQEQLARRVSINGLSPVPQRCNRL
ncbi:hypothetical protein CRENBAI_002498 [Crenichthys baileyi]|uniref:Uncharacterized protein n=1 Tax=Crenichthys baileyi TaxID=28760 RepID=A0AAV9R0R6_9TELE